MNSMSEEIKVSEMQEAKEINDEDLLMLIQKNANKKVTIKQIKNLFQIIDNLTSISTTDALSAKQGKILNDKITNTNTYSTEEVNTGKKWIDGKDIYRKVITQNNANQIDLANLSIDTLIEKRGQVKVTNPSYDICALDFSWTGGDSVLRGIFTQYTGTKLVFNPKNITVGYIHVILEYTKAS